MTARVVYRHILPIDQRLSTYLDFDRRNVFMYSFVTCLDTYRYIMEGAKIKENTLTADMDNRQIVIDRL